MFGFQTVAWSNSEPMSALFQVVAVWWIFFMSGVSHWFDRFHQEGARKGCWPPRCVTHRQHARISISRFYRNWYSFLSRNMDYNISFLFLFICLYLLYVSLFLVALVSLHNITRKINSNWLLYDPEENWRTVLYKKRWVKRIVYNVVSALLNRFVIKNKRANK